MSLLVEDWVVRLMVKQQAGAGHAFILAGNVTDYVSREKPKDGAPGALNYYTMRATLDRICGQHLGPFAFVLHYDIAGRLQFATPEMLERFRKFVSAREQAVRKERAEKLAALAQEKQPKGKKKTPTPQKAHAFGAFRAPSADIEEMIAEDAEESRKMDAQEEAAAEAQLIEELPVDLRRFYLELDDNEKAIVRNLPNFEARVSHLLNLAEADARKKVNPLATDAPDGNAPFELPEKPAHIWAFLRAVLAIDFEECAKHLKPVDSAFQNGLVRAAVVVVIHRPELAVDGAGMNARLSDFEQMVQATLLGVASDSSIGLCGNLLMLVTEDENRLPESLTRPTSGFTVIEIPHPHEKSRAAFIEALPERLSALVSEEVRFSEKPLALPDGVTSHEMGRGVSAGLRLVDLENVGREALVARARPDDDTPRLTADALWQQKRVYLTRASGGQVKVKRPTVSFDWIGGHDEVKAYFRQVAEFMRRGDRSRIPKGVLLVGPPGTGKSMLSQGLATLVGYSFCTIEGEFDPFVGMSARNFKRNRRVIMQMEPVVVFEDEIDRKHLPRGAVFHGDSGTAANQEALNHEFMADDGRRGKVLWISAANKPDHLEAALTRPGRFDRIIPILPPKTPEGWAAVFEGVAKKMQVTVEPPFVWAVPPDALLEFAGQLPPDTMQGHVNEFCYRARFYTGPEGVLGPKELKRGIADYRPRKEPEYEKQIKLALEFANSEDLIPAAYRTHGVPVEDVQQEPEVTLIIQGYKKAPPGTPTPPAGGGGEDGGGKGGNN